MEQQWTPDGDIGAKTAAWYDAGRGRWLGQQWERTGAGHGEERSEQELFTAMGGVDPRPVNRWEAVRTDPYHRFSSTTSDRYKHTWTGKRDQKVTRE